ncbi:MAG: hypothetical protein SFU86_23085 [Pirellulaceae bacterium]|nr:hypothetical protein [Pirellulaceae bacterium]
MPRPILTMSFQSPRLLSVLAVLVALPFAGCRRDEAQLPVHPVTGKITFDGQAPAGAQIVLHPQGGPATEVKVAPLGTVRTDGTFKISTYGDGDGAPAGEYAATVQWFKVETGEGGSGRGPNVLPGKYASAEATPIKISVKAGINEVPPITIVR